MADEVGDTEFARRMPRHPVEAGQKNLVAQLFDGEYFINKVDPKHLDAINSGTGCEIDQVFGQSWAFQVGLPRVLPREGNCVRAEIALALQFFAGCRAVSRGLQAGPLVRHGRARPGC